MTENDYSEDSYHMQIESIQLGDLTSLIPKLDKPKRKEYAAIKEARAAAAENLSGTLHEAMHLLHEKYDNYETHKLDTQKRVFFYEQDFYVLSNFSSFNVTHVGVTYATVEHAYHTNKFSNSIIQEVIANSPSAHEAFRRARRYKDKVRSDWDDIKFDVMRTLLRLKVEQHFYVMKKLLATGDRELIEDSWRDDIWGWGPNRDGQNMLGKLWMELRDEMLARNAGNFHR